MRRRLADIRALAGKLLRMACVFLLVFSTSYGIELSLAFGDETGSDEPIVEGEGGSGEEPGGEEPGGEEPQPNVITWLGVYSDEGDHTLASGWPWRTVYDTADGKSQPEVPQITARKGELHFYSSIIWEGPDYAGVEENGSNYVQWSVADGDEAIAVFTSRDSSTLVATGEAEGTVTVTCSLKEEYVEKVDPAFVERYPGQPFEVSFRVNVAGQSGPVVTDITLLREDGTAFGTPGGRSEGDVIDAGTGVVFDYQSLSSAMYEFGALVTVQDPSDGSTSQYTVTAGNGLAAQTGGALPDLAWWCTDELGFISEDGLFRIAVSGAGEVRCSSPSGIGGSTVRSNQVSITVSDNYGDEGHKHDFESDQKQDFLAVEVYDEIDLGTVKYRIEYTADEVMSTFPTHYETYTLVGGSSTYGYATASGIGTYLDEILDMNGIDKTRIKELRFNTYDNWDSAVSYGLLATPGYWYKGADIGDYSSRNRVAAKAMIAWASAWRGNENTTEAIPYEDLEASSAQNTRFRLLLGSHSADETVTGFSVKWINTIKVILYHQVPDLSAVLHYTPAPIGGTAIMHCAVNGTDGAAVSYNWKHSSDGKNWETVYTGGADYEVVLSEDLRDTFYRVDVSSIDGRTAKSNYVVVQVMPNEFSAMITYEPIEIGKMTTLHCTVNDPDGKTHRYTYAWEHSIDGKSWNKQEGSEAQLTVGVTDKTVNTWYRVSVTRADDNKTVTAQAQLVTNPPDPVPPDPDDPGGGGGVVPVPGDDDGKDDSNNGKGSAAAAPSQQKAEQGNDVTSADKAAASGAAESKVRVSRLREIAAQDPAIDLLQLLNPLAPFIFPICLAAFASGALEKLLGYRNQKRRPAAA